MIRIAAQEARTLAERALEACGAPRNHAASQATLLVEGDLRGRASHGMQRLPTLVARIENRLLNPRAEPELDWRTAAFVAVDGHHGFGCVAAHRAIDALLDAAKQTGVAMAAIRASSHLGMLAPYVERIAGAGQVGLLLTTSEALVHPAGGRTALLGTNPISIGFPAEPHPFVLDMSTAAISAGEILDHARRGALLPAGCAVDAAGSPTNSPELALRGSISPFGGAKGYGLALAVELLVAWASVSALGTDVVGTLDAEHRATKGDLVVVLDPSASGLPEPATYVSTYLDEVRAAPTAPKIKSVVVPGDRMRAERECRLTDGIPYPDSLWAELSSLRTHSGEAAGHV